MVRHTFAASAALSISLALMGTTACAAGEGLTPVPNPGMKVNFVELKGYKGADHDKVMGAAQVLESILNSEEFRQSVLAFVYKDRTQFNDNEGLTNEQVYETLMRGKESYVPADDYTLDVSLTLYTPPWYKKRTVIGYTYPSSSMIWVNKYYFHDFTLGEVAANIAHEWTHKLGFGHDYDRTSGRPYSVPYGIGGIVRTLAAKL